ncbi:hypothetical protein AYO21_11326 [Fonsecaea monophora]|uniref:CoA-transferase family III n=1 Tax=Fonsecaea monophora TaxID=254056 RepID=A0A177ER63_9EURO|nr:hypothetical protein AYO21_11326 [Fonsecaea monophora]OAG34504.1 hypothetical protein AYO21_11326 [Fonsecaea monophora]
MGMGPPMRGLLQVFTRHASTRLRPQTTRPCLSLGRSSSRYLSSQGQGKAGLINNIKVLDLSRVIAGPFCAQILADYGATVIKVEQPQKGDDLRHYKPPVEKDNWDPKLGPMSNFFAACNRNKRSICLDLKSPKAHEILFELAKDADVIIENFVPGKIDELGLGYDKLKQVNPRIIYASISGIAISFTSLALVPQVTKRSCIGYGSKGPWAKRAGYDMIVGAEAGLMHITGPRGGPPTKPGVSIIDLCTGLYLHGAILGALLARQETGLGQRVTVSLFESMVSLLINVGMDWVNSGQEAQRWGTAHPSVVPYDAWKTKDSHVVTGASTERQWRRLCDILGRPDLVDDERFENNSARVKNREVITPILRECFESRTTDEWLERFEGSGMPYGAINNMERVFKHPQIEAGEMLQPVEYEGLKSGVLKLLGPPVKFSEAATPVKLRPPLLGEHTSEVLREIGLSDAAIEDLQKTGVTQ